MLPKLKFQPSYILTVIGGGGGGGGGVAGAATVTFGNFISGRQVRA